MEESGSLGGERPRLDTESFPSTGPDTFQDDWLWLSTRFLFTGQEQFLREEMVSLLGS